MDSLSTFYQEYPSADTTVTGSHSAAVISCFLCQMDSLSMFYQEYPSADTTVTGIVTLLAAAKALWNLQGTIEAKVGSKDVMFAFFQGVGNSIVLSVHFLSVCHDFLIPHPWPCRPVHRRREAGGFLMSPPLSGISGLPV